MKFVEYKNLILKNIYTECTNNINNINLHTSANREKEKEHENAM